MGSDGIVLIMGGAGFISSILVYIVWPSSSPYATSHFRHDKYFYCFFIFIIFKIILMIVMMMMIIIIYYVGTWTLIGMRQSASAWASVKTCITQHQKLRCQKTCDQGSLAAASHPQEFFSVMPYRNCNA